VQARGTETGEEDGAGGVAVGSGGSKRAKALSIAPSSMLLYRARDAFAVRGCTAKRDFDDRSSHRYRE